MPRKTTPLVLATAALIAAWPAFGRPSASRELEATRMSMGCLWSIAAHGSNRDALARTLERALDEVDRIDRLMSHYRDDSPLSRINREAARRPVVVVPELFDFIELSLRYGRESNGAFDVTVGPLMNTWGFFRGDGKVPTDEQLLRARSVTGMSHVTLNPRDRTIRFDREGVAIDLGGIAKGYAVDRAVDTLRRERVEAALVSACGSTVYALGNPPDAASWSIEIQDPLEGSTIAFSVPLKNRALSVSGVAEKFFEMNGVRYSHIMDPRTGRPVQGVLSVIVQAPTGVDGDAIDNVLFVEGPERGRAYLRRHPGVEAAFLLPALHGWKRVDMP